MLSTQATEESHQPLLASNTTCTFLLCSGLFSKLDFYSTLSLAYKYFK